MWAAGQLRFSVTAALLCRLDPVADLTRSEDVRHWRTNILLHLFLSIFIYFAFSIGRQDTETESETASPLSLFPLPPQPHRVLTTAEYWRKITAMENTDLFIANCWIFCSGSTQIRGKRGIFRVGANAPDVKLPPGLSGPSRKCNKHRNNVLLSINVWPFCFRELRPLEAMLTRSKIPDLQIFSGLSQLANSLRGDLNWPVSWAVKFSSHVFAKEYF